MILLDSDHLSVLGFENNERSQKLQQRLSAASSELIGITVISIEEQMRGWMATIAKERLAKRQINAYRGLAAVLNWFARFPVILFDEKAAEQFDELRASKIRVGTMDLKIASIALTNNALLLTANRSDFELVPTLRFDNWLD